MRGDPGQFKLEMYEQFESAVCDLECSKCGATVCQLEDSQTLEAVLSRAAAHECLPQVWDALEVSVPEAESPVQRKARERLARRLFG